MQGLFCSFFAVFFFKRWSASNNQAWLLPVLRPFCPALLTLRRCMLQHTEQSHEIASVLSARHCHDRVPYFSIVNCTSYPVEVVGDRVREVGNVVGVEVKCSTG